MNKYRSVMNKFMTVMNKSRSDMNNFSGYEQIPVRYEQIHDGYEQKLRKQGPMALLVILLLLFQPFLPGNGTDKSVHMYRAFSVSP